MSVEDSLELLSVSLRGEDRKVQEQELDWKITWHLQTDDDGAVQCVRAFVNDPDFRDFYVGITSSPAWRWSGGVSRQGFTMRGHHESYDHMIVVRNTIARTRGVLLDKCLIKEVSVAKRRCQIRSECGESVKKSATSVLYLYIVYRRTDWGVT